MTEKIYLQPECCAGEDGQMWCDSPDPVDCENGNPWTEYIRADVVEAAQVKSGEDIASIKVILQMTSSLLDKKMQALHEIYEVWAGSENINPETAGENYLLNMVKEMRDIAGKHK